MVKQRRRSELSLQRIKDRVCSEECKFIGNKSKSIMFIGDRGYGVGSNIKGHIRYDARDAVSALDIGLSGAASLILDIAFPSFDPNTSQSKTERFKNTAVAFLKRNASRPAFPK
ncbi:hypothetical protein EDC94DRAFT_651101, partial [Helicostylum pulchrum]